MQLRDMLSVEMADKLKSIKDTEKSSVKPKTKLKSKSKAKPKMKDINAPKVEAEKAKAPFLEKVKVSSLKKNAVEKKEKPERHRLKYVNECPYCGCSALEEKANGYVLCENCGINIEKR